MKYYRAAGLVSNMSVSATDFPSVDTTLPSARRARSCSRTSTSRLGWRPRSAFGDVMEARYPEGDPDACPVPPSSAQALEEGGLTHSQIEAVLGGNFYRAFNECWTNR